MKKFEEGKFNDTYIFNAWFKYCSKEQIPYVIIRNQTKYSTVELDYINLNPILEKKITDNSEEHRLQLLKIFKNFAGSKSEFLISDLTFFVEKIPRENAHSFAEALFDVVKNRINN